MYQNVLKFDLLNRSGHVAMPANVPLLGEVADTVNELMKTKFNISRVFSAEKLNGNSAKPML